MKSKKIKNGNKLDQATAFTLGDMYDELKSKRSLVFDVSIDVRTEPNFAFFGTE
jgi:hypothetical protein